MADQKMTPVRAASRGMDLLAQEALEYLRRKYCTLWDHIGRDPETGGWRASRTIKPGVTHHVVTRTVADLDRELAAIEADGTGA